VAHAGYLSTAIPCREATACRLTADVRRRPTGLGRGVDVSSPLARPPTELTHRFPDRRHVLRAWAPAGGFDGDAFELFVGREEVLDLAQVVLRRGFEVVDAVFTIVVLSRESVREQFFAEPRG